MDTFDALIARCAARQLGLFTRAQVLAVGGSVRLIDRRLEAGRWVRVGPGVYRLAGSPVTWHQRALAACLVAGAGAVISHRAAAVMYSVSGFRAGPLEITVPLGRGTRNPLAMVHRSATLPAAHTTRQRGIPVTRPARMLADLAGRVGPPRLEEAVDDVLCRRLADLATLGRGLEQLGPRRGSAVLRAILDAWNGAGLAANGAEMRIHRVLVAAGLPEPVRQHEIRQGGDLVARVDLAYPDHRLAVELDSFRWHAGRGPFRSDRVRGNRIAAMGWRLLRATVEDADDGRDLVRAVRGMLSVAA